MASQSFSNYLLKYRKRSGLSQEEVAVLLGTRSGAKVCRYEKFLREPGLESALALQVIFERPVAELFQGLFQKIEAQVRERAKKLAQNKPSGKLSPFATHKRQTLAGIASGHVKSQTKRS